MKLDERQIIDQALVAEEPCLGAVFCSYTFDPAYFEDHVLRALLRLRGDPEEDAARYHEEARGALRDTPVACFVDASVRSPGRRLPYDLHLVRRRTFHPKLTLVLYESEARLAVGSGNLTKAGLEQNTELFFVRRLRYDEPADVTILRDVDEFLAATGALHGTPGTQLDLVQKTLRSLLPSPASQQPSDIKFVSSYGGPLVDQLSAHIPESAKLSRVGVLAPFFEQDDLAVGGDDGIQVVLAELLALRPSRGASVDIGAPWDDAPLAAPDSAPADSLDDELGSLWAWRRRATLAGSTIERVEYFVVETTAAKRIQGTNAAGEACRHDRDELEAEIAERRLWRVAKPTVHAPKAILRHLAAKHSLRLWLHPTAGISASGRAYRRPLHAKVILMTTVHRGRTVTYAFIGSANASRGALARSVAQGGNVEAGVLCRFDGEIRLRDLLPSLVSYTLYGVDLVEREAPSPTVDLSAWIDEVVHDAAARTLRVLWRTEGPASLGTWSLRYLAREVASGEGTPSTPTEIVGFELDAASAEVTFAAAGDEWQLPIRVSDLAALPANPFLATLGLRELLALLGRRIGGERLATLRTERGAAGVASVLDAVFGEGFGPTDVFKAWWGAIDDLQTAATVAAFRHRLEGPTGLLAVWRRLRDVPEDVLSQDQVWVHGCELLRELRNLELPAGSEAETRRVLIGKAIAELDADLHRLAPDAAAHPWLHEVSRFYGLRVPNDTT